MKDTYYFSHDFNARNDPKCSALIHEYGPEGYGVFWMLIEIMAEQEEHKIKKFPKLYEGLARQFSIEHSRLRSIIEALLQDYELLLQDEKYIWSDSLNRRMHDKDSKRNAKIEAGRLGGLKSGLSRNKGKQEEAETKQAEAVLEANEPKEKKRKESKGNENNIYTPEFELFYSEYPRPEDKRRTFTNWKTQLKHFTADQLMLACSNYKKAKANTDKQYLKSSANFLGKEKPFEDFIKPTEQGQPQSKYREFKGDEYR